MDNIFEKHIKNTQKRFRSYTNMILKSKYDSKVTEELIQSYIDARYYNFDVDDSIKIFYRRIYDTLKRKSIKLKEKYPGKEETIEKTLSLFQYYFYFDGVRRNPDMEKILDTLVEMRLFDLKLKSAINDNFREEFNKMVIQDMVDNDNEFNKYETKDFELDIKKVSQYNNEFYRVNLKYNFDFPKIFSKEAIEEVFNTDIIGEDRLFVEYPMVAVVALKDIINGVFNKRYICDFNPSILLKEKKLDNLVQTLYNQAAQDKVCFEVTYNQFKDYKNDIFKLVKRGFKFVLRTDEEMPRLTNEALRIIELFSCVIIDTNDVNKGKYTNTKKILI